MYELRWVRCMNEKRRLRACCLLLLLIISLLISLGCALKLAGHACVGIYCTSCFKMAFCLHLWHENMVNIWTLQTVLVLFLIAYVIGLFKSDRKETTLVSLNIKLSN